MAEMFNYIKTRDTADRLLAKFGQAVSLRRMTNTGTAWAPTQTPTDYPTKAAIVEYDARQIDGETILSTDRRALVAAGPLAALGITSISAPDRLVVGGIAIPVVRAKTLAPSGTVVMFDCQLRA